VIDVVTEVLGELGLLPHGRIEGLQVGLTRGDTLWLDAFVDGPTFVHVKLSDAVSLREEVRVYDAAFGTFGALMPRPFGRVVRGGWDIFVCAGVGHRPLLAHDVLAAGPDVMHDFFVAARRGRRRSATANLALLARLEDAYRGTPFDAALAPWRSEEARAALAGLGEAPQHGDFALNNLGLGHDGLVVFDWEDFGKVALPGLDLCTLLVSALDLDAPRAADALLGRCEDGRRFAPTLDRACHALELPVPTFRRAVPLYLLAFLQLKEAYAAAVHARIARILARVCATLPAIQAAAAHD
jgi:hypothetical protein